MLSLTILQGELDERDRQLEASIGAIMKRVMGMQDQTLRTNMAIRAQNYVEVAERSVAQDVDLANCLQALRDLKQEHSVCIALMVEARKRWEALGSSLI